MTRSQSELRRDAQAIFRSALAAADARKAIGRHLRLSDDHRTLTVDDRLALNLSRFRRAVIVGAGKAAAPMTVALEELLHGALTVSGSINVKYGHVVPRPRQVVVHECGHPVPDQAGVMGARAIERILEDLGSTDLLFAVVSGGASALLSAPAEGITLEDKQAITAALLRAGADINELNAVRKHLSRLKGGQLAMRSRGATVVALLLSDVVGNRLDVIGSGITVGDPSRFSDAVTVLRRYGLMEVAPPAVVERLLRGERGEISETPAGEMPEGVHNIVVGSNQEALEAARAEAERRGYEVRVITGEMVGEAREVAWEQTALVAGGRKLLKRKTCWLAGGETTVTIRGQGQGGRNQEFALAGAIKLRGEDGVVLLAAGTDGTDGPTDAAGGIVDSKSVSRARELGLDPEESLAQNDSYPLLAATGDLLRTGPTGTNVMDIVVWLAEPEG